MENNLAWWLDYDSHLLLLAMNRCVYVNSNNSNSTKSVSEGRKTKKVLEKEEKKQVLEKEEKQNQKI